MDTIKNTKKQRLAHTINLHLTLLCNYACGFCYAGFPGIKQKFLNLEVILEILRQIARAPKPIGCKCRKVTFVGGEPLLFKGIYEAIAYARSLGLVTSLVTNASLLSDDAIRQLGPILDWLTISIDSTDDATNLKIGRAFRGMPQTKGEYLRKIKLAKSFGIRVKINTVVNQKNADEDFNDFIEQARPTRWKVLQASRVEEENGSCFNQWVVTQERFDAFVSRHASLSSQGVTVIPETQSDIRGTYAMISPDGRFFDTLEGTYNYSRPILDVGIEEAFSDVNFSMERFKQRDGDYDFATGLNAERGAK
ncbi:viperin family antiviral radical SAM protein [Coraliomargarita sp. SDUM461004]|uniref:S-adenosylmethionine-dependent nucleotide dehydratase n=1 Tax=Thalassobacterium sedimentorum TaxID=3041258 RepID=A0ABU1ALZ9_9BACT|nr:viperin family antiviral radical SAM protein [Coraliomargarita sp. SDUM461004]MDQ8195694.1 viperin family antiviral radical SAM protein [Coraliomargarita sp. SDUM461004]